MAAIIAEIMENLDVTISEARDIIDDLKSDVNHYISRGDIGSAEEALFEYGIEMEDFIDAVMC